MFVFLSYSTSLTSPLSLFLKKSPLLLRHHLYTMSSPPISFRPHTFAGNPIKSHTPKPSDPFSSASALDALKTHLLSSSPNDPILSPCFKVLPFRKGRPLAGTSLPGPIWRLGWLSLGECKGLLADFLGEGKLVYLGSRPQEDEVYWAVDVSEEGEGEREREREREMVVELGKRELSFVELRTLMVATDWSDPRAMADLAVAGHARALLEWHGLARFCGHCGFKTIPMEAGRRVQCSNELCKKRIYPRVDPVVIMLVIDRQNDRALLSRQARFVPRMWSCLAGFIEPGESLEEAVRRETWEETGIEVGEVVYHSSQPWPVGPSSMPCQLMVGFFAYAKSLEINVDKDELEDARWHSREEVRNAISVAEYEKAQRTAASKVDQICKGVKQVQNLASDFNTESGELAPMFFPGPFAIAHHLISKWAFEGSSGGSETQLKQPNSSLSNL